MRSKQLPTEHKRSSTSGTTTSWSWLRWLLVTFDRFASLYQDILLGWLFWISYVTSTWTVRTELKLLRRQRLKPGIWQRAREYLWFRLHKPAILLLAKLCLAVVMWMGRTWAFLDKSTS